jgi:hypothetical protein
MAYRRASNGWTLLLALVGMVGMFASALAADSTVPGGQRMAIKGYDPVAYFTEGRPVQGRAEFEQVWENTRWRFASAANRDLFKSDPDRYAPQYAGYCAYGVVKGAKTEVDPQAWTIVNGKLYLNYSRDIRTDWAKDQAENIKRADANWPSVNK